MRSAQAVLQEWRKNVRAPAELAFYGGTFTGLDEGRLRECLDFARALVRQGLISGFRCSTRPDFVTPEICRRLRQSGCRLVELGIQSFAQEPLLASQRGYLGAEARAACRYIKDFGLELGVQLMPGMPGCTVRHFLADVREALELGCQGLRFYPCLVLPETPLAVLWQRGSYRPWSIGRTVCALARGLNLARDRGVPVIRIGLHPQPGLAVLAGPEHPALGSRVMGYALYLKVKEIAQGKRLVGMEAPKSCSGFLYGWQGELKRRWEQLCESQIRFGAGPMRLWLADRA